jgi:hypothetical protein
MKPKDQDEFAELRSDLEQIIGDGTTVWQRQQAARDLRFNLWDGQSDDGRKYEKNLGEVPLPFEGASDLRVPLLDGVIQDIKDTAQLMFFRSQVQALPVEPDDAPRSQGITTLLRWLRDREMRAELEDEVELSAEYMFADDPGIAIVEVCWMRDTNLERRSLTLEQLAILYATGETNPDQVSPDDPRLEPEMLGDFADLATNPIREPEFLRWLSSVYPVVTDPTLRKAIRDLRKTGQAELPVPVIRENRPSVQALRFLEDVFFPIGTANIQRARNVHRREWVNEDELRERAFTLGWDADVVEEVISRGRGQSIVAGTIGQSTSRHGNQFSGPGMAVDESDNLFEIWWSYSRRADELGVMGVYCTIWNGSVPDRPLKNELRANRHGRYPFVVRPRERTGRQLTESRGLTRPLATHQTEIKVQRDARSNFIQLIASPPHKVRMDRGAFDLIVAPNAAVPVMRQDDVEWFTPPGQLPQYSVEMERTTRHEVDEYAGRMTADQDPNRVATKQQRSADRFFGLWREVFTMVLDDCRDYYSAAEIARITGATGEPANLTPEDLAGRWDILIEIDARDLNMEYAMKKLDALTKVAAADSSGTLDRGPIAEWGAYTIDPVLARRTVRPQQNVTQREIDATKNAITQMAAGIEPDMPVQGINAQLRMNVLMQTVKSSQQLAQAYQQGGSFRELLDNYQKYLTQQLTQDQNKVVGRLGTAPLQQGPQSAQFGGG